MYNEEQKNKFIREYTGSLNTANIATAIFNAIEPYENQWGADIVTRELGDTQPVVDSILGLRTRSKQMTLIILREYAKWCIVTGVRGATDSLLRVNSSDLEKLKLQMVSSPLHLQKCLDEIFEPESEETIDNIYRCYFWMAFCGIEEKDTVVVNGKDIDLSGMYIRYRDKDIDLYRESMQAFRNAATLSTFVYKHPLYDPVRRDRVIGAEILRGIRGEPNVIKIRNTVSRMNKEAINSGRTTAKISFKRVQTSGLFYRTFEYERAGVSIDFKEAAMNQMGDKEYSLAENQKPIHIQNRIEKGFMEDYKRWKLAFSI